VKVIFAVVPSAVAVTPIPIKLIEVNVVPTLTPSSSTSIPVKDVAIISCIVERLSILVQVIPLPTVTKICPEEPELLFTSYTAPLNLTSPATSKSLVALVVPIPTFPTTCNTVSFSV
jgi:hypothetical protein